nr:response regulator [uncultured Allomuricauda sp.]
MKSVFLSITTFLLLNTAVFAQNESLPEDSSEPPVTYNKKELDSLLLELRKEFYNANYEIIIEHAPGLIQNAVQINAPQTEERLISALGNAFIQFDEHENAYNLFNQSLNRAKKKKDTFSILSAYINLGNTFIFKEPEKAIKYFEKGTEYLKAERNQAEINFSDRASFILHNNLAELYVGIKKPKKAQYYLDESQSLLSLPSLAPAKEEYTATGYHIQGAIDLLENRYDAAISNSHKALSDGEGLLDENYVINAYKVLLDAYGKTGKYKELSDIRIPYDSLKDKRYESEKIRQQQIANSKFNLEKYKQELRETQLAGELSQQKASKNKLLFIFSAILGGVLALLIGVLLFAGYKRNHLLSDLRKKNHQYLGAKEVSEQLARSNTRFLSTISHELRTPLYGIIGLSSVLMKNDKLDDESLEEIKSLKFSADYLLALVNDVLHINKFESEEGRKLQNDHFILNNLIQNIVQSFEFNNQKNNNSVQVDIDSRIPEVLLGDKMKLSQVLMNLISNASKFTEDGDISISMKLDNKNDDTIGILFSIEDSGKGIPLDEQNKIFDEFTQVKTDNSQGGTGLGLPIVNKILHILDSKLQFKSAEGVGTAFSFLLQLKESSMEHVQSAVVLPNSDALKGKHILIVDDNKINQLVTQKVLAQYEIQYAVANDGVEAIEKVKEHAFDAVLMDINMPRMNGFDASKEIRTFNKVVPIIALTATIYDGIHEKLSYCGVDDAIVKPYDTEMLLKALTKHICLQKRYPFGTVSSAIGETIKYSG